jgi:hypothetical protein
VALDRERRSVIAESAAFDPEFPFNRSSHPKTRLPFPDPASKANEEVFYTNRSIVRAASSVIHSFSQSSNQPGAFLGTLLAATTAEKKEENMDLLWTLAVILVILWLLGMVTSYTLGGFVHILLVIAIVVVLIRVIQGRRPIP